MPLQILPCLQTICGAEFLVMENRDKAVFLDAVLRPNPPMNPRALLIILIIVALINFIFGLSFVLHGAWPIMPFLGADVGLLAWAFYASRRAAKRYETVTVTPGELAVVRHPPKGAPQAFSLNPYWVRVCLDGDEEHARNLTLRSHGRTVPLGSFLNSHDRFSFAQILKNALEQARGYRP